MTHAPDRHEVDVAELARGEAYPWLNAGIIPRAIAWVSTISADGTDNLAPHSFTTVAAVDPPTVCFTSVGEHDTLRNVRETGEFVLAIGGEEQTRWINDSATPFDHATSEFDAATVTREASALVRPPRVAGAPVVYECRVSGEHAIGGSTMVFGEVVRIAARTDCLADDGLPDPRLMAPVARLGRNEWSRLGEVFTLDRITADEWDDGARSPHPFT